MSNLFCARCSACGCSTLITANPGTVRTIAIEHEGACEFLAAVEAGTAINYVRKHGYPITYKPQSAAGAA